MLLSLLEKIGNSSVISEKNRAVFKELVNEGDLEQICEVLFAWGESLEARLTKREELINMFASKISRQKAELESLGNRIIVNEGL